MAVSRQTRLDPEALCTLYMTAKERVIDAGFADEIDWQADMDSIDWSESTFLRESAWVVLSSGFREEILRRRFPLVSAAFLNWESASSIMSRRETCRSSALQAFANIRKIDGILEIARRVACEGIDAIRNGLKIGGTDFLQRFPFIGPVTACHLAKNLGMSIVKPDRHLARLATRTGYGTADQMCRIIAEIVGDTLPVIDVVLWRYATITDQYETDFGNRQRRDMACV